PPVPPGRAGGAVAAVRAYFRECFTRPYFLWVYATVALSWMAIVVVNLFNLFYAQSVGMSMDTYGKYLAATFLISFILSYMLGSFADRLHPLRLGLGLMTFYAIVMFGAGLFIHDAPSFGIALLAYGVIGGSWQTATASLTMKLFPQSR